MKNTNASKAIIFAIKPSSNEQKTFIDWRLQLVFLCAHCLEHDLQVIERSVLSGEQDKDQVSKMIKFIKSQSEPVALVFSSLTVFQHKCQTNKELETLLHLKNTEVHFVQEQIVRRNDNV